MLYQEDGDPEAGYEHPTGIGRIDLLAKHRNEPRWLVVELKRNQSSDKTMGQVLRYMGWVKQHLATDEQAVEGLVISRSRDEQLEYALSPVPNVTAKRYHVQFYLE
ncbi:MAG: endonuclease NucS [Candidatus Hydrogenedentota bacterium]